MIKAVFFDIDGTLVSFKTHRVPPSTVQALERLRARGIKLFIATGRHHADLNNLGGLAFDGYITLNGQYCYDDRGVIYQNCIRAEDIRTTVDLLARDPFGCLFIEEHRMYINRIDDKVKVSQKLINFADPPVVPAETALHNDIYQLMAFVGPEQERTLMDSLPHCDSTRWNPYFIDVVPAGGRKRLGIDAMIRAHGIDLAETMAFGDGQNDIEMLRHAGIGVAMGNAADEVKRSADYVTTGVDRAGIAKALRHFGL